MSLTHIAPDTMTELMRLVEREHQRLNDLEAQVKQLAGTVEEMDCQLKVTQRQIGFLRGRTNYAEMMQP